MKALRNYLDKIKPNFEEGGKLHAFRSVFDGFETFLFVPNSTSKTGVHIHDAIDSKRIMSMVVIALIPALLFGMYNVGYQHFLAVGQEAGFFEKFIYGFLAVLPKIIVSYVVGLGIEFVVALHCMTFTHTMKSTMEERRNSGRFPGIRSVDPDDRSCGMSVVDSGCRYSILCYLR